MCCQYLGEGGLKVHKNCIPFLKCFKCDYRTNSDKQYEDHYVLCHLKQGLNEYKDNLLKDCKKIAKGEKVMRIKDLWLIVNEKDTKEDIAKPAKRCPKCTKAFNKNIDVYFQAHLKGCIVKENDPVCPKCHKPLKNVQSYNNHIVNCKETKEEKTCNKCGREFGRMSHLRYHAKHCGLINRINYPDVTCWNCKEFKSAFWKFREHIDQCIKEKLNDSNHMCFYCYRVIEGPRGTKHNCDYVLKCDKCPFEAAREDHYRHHYKEFHFNEVKEFYCDICGKKYDAKYKLKKHLLSHDERSKVNCEVCGKSIANKRTLKRHMEVHNREQIPCHLCGKFYESARKLLRHKRAMHTSEFGNVKCPHCPYSTVHDRFLMTHTKNTHPQMIIKCKHCSISFISLNLYNDHLALCESKVLLRDQK